VIAAIDTIVKFLKNDKKYKPLQATVMRCGGTGKSFIINTCSPRSKSLSLNIE
jgi:hypothetical protein